MDARSQAIGGRVDDQPEPPLRRYISDLLPQPPLGGGRRQLASEAASWERPALFRWLQAQGGVGETEFLAGQILGKLWMVLLTLPFIHWIRKREIARERSA